MDNRRLLPTKEVIYPLQNTNKGLKGNTDTPKQDSVDQQNAITKAELKHGNQKL